MTREQLEIIRQRAVGLGLKADVEEGAGRASVFVELPYGAVSAYFVGKTKPLTTVQVWGPLSASASEIDALHELLVAGFAPHEVAP